MPLSRDSALARPASLILSLLVFALGIGLSLRYGIRDYLSRDSDITWHIAERVMHGEIPDVDFLFFTNLVPALMQVPFFAALGFTFHALVAHAAVVNGLAGIVVFLLLRRLGLSLGPATLYAAATTVIFYPPLGGVYPQAHSFFFGMIAVLAQVAALKEERGGATRWYALAGLMWTFAYLSRPSPVCFLVPLAAVLFLTLPARFMLRALFSGMAGALTPVAILLAVVAGFGGSPRDLLHYELVVPFSIGQSRQMLSPLMIFTIHDLNLASLVVATVGTAVAVIRSIAEIKAASWGQLRHDNRILALVVGGGFLAATLLFLNTAVQDFFASAQLVFVIVGCVHAALLPPADQGQTAGWYDFRASGIAGLLLMGTVIFDAGWFQINANALRGYPASGTIHTEVPRAADGIPAFDGLRFFTRVGADGRIDTENELRARFDLYRQTIAALTQANGSPMLCFLPHTLYRMADRPSPIPAVGISAPYNGPPVGSPDYERLVTLLRRNIQRYSLSTAIIPAADWADARVAGHLQSVACATETRGHIRIVELCAPTDPRTIDFLMGCAGLAP